MASADQASSKSPEPSDTPRKRGRIGRLFSSSRELMRITYRDPEHVAERLTLAIPIGFIAYVDHVRKTVEVNGLGALGAVVALSLVIATAVIPSRQ